ncbi:MAG: TIGR02221 family CRISPR-associated protein [Bacteroidaceae bacterium]|nr:TIGR02221 family CRISPR-associated protein [Bacteroidaceae bacterium]
MARKVFISLLGASIYRECVYTKENFRSQPVRFVQEATLDMLLRQGQWLSTDAAYILLTETAEKNNWHDNGHEREQYEGLCTRLKKMSLPFEVMTIKNLPIGNNEDEIWKIFETIYEQIQEGDTLYFDITHCFRYMPMIVLALINYSKFLKNTVVANILYGNWEARNAETNEAPIMDFLPISTLLDWNHAAGQFIESGSVSNMMNLCNDVLIPIMRDSKRRDKETLELGNFVKKLNELVSDFNTCRGFNIIDSKNLNFLLNSFEKMNVDLIPPFKPLFKRIIEPLNSFSTKSNAQNMIHAARWCFNNKMFQQAVTLLEEGIITLVCERHRLNPFDKDDRKLVSDAIYYRGKTSDSEIISPASYNNPANMIAVKDIFNDKEFITDEFVTKYTLLQDTRNNYNHAGMNKNKWSSKALIEKIEGSLQFFENILSGEIGRYTKKTEETEPVLASQPIMLINFSNHPYSVWSDEQKSAAATYGNVVDIQFPMVDETGDETYIKSLADEYVQKIMSHGGNSNVVVHLMGEFSLSHSVLHRLQNAGYKCVVSTTKRIVEMLDDGSKKVSFKFCKFREYENK